MPIYDQYVSSLRALQVVKFNYVYNKRKYLKIRPLGLHKERGCHHDLVHDSAKLLVCVACTHDEPGRVQLPLHQHCYTNITDNTCDEPVHIQAHLPTQWLNSETSTMSMLCKTIMLLNSAVLLIYFMFLTSASSVSNIPCNTSLLGCQCCRTSSLIHCTRQTFHSKQHDTDNTQHSIYLSVITTVFIMLIIARSREISLCR